MGTKGVNRRIQDFVSRASSSSPLSGQFRQPIAREGTDQGSVGTRSFGERGLRVSSDHLFPGFLQPLIHCSKGVRPLETHHRSFHPEHVCQHSHLQDGHLGSNQTLFDTRQLGSITRSARCISPVASSREPSQVSSLHVSQDRLSVPGTTVRAVDFPLDFHDSHGRSEENVASSGYSNLHVPRRLASHCRVRTPLQHPHDDSSATLPEVRFSHKRGEVQIHSESGVHLSRFPSGPSQFHVLPHRGTNREDPTVMFTNPVSTGSHSSPVAGFVGSASIHGEGGTLGQTTHQGVGLPPTAMLGFRPSHTITFCTDDTRVDRRVGLVDAATQCSPRNTASSTGTSTSGSYGRLTGGMGRTLPHVATESVRIVEALPEISPHQLVGNEGHPSGPAALGQHPCPSDSPDRVGQRHGRGVPQQAGGVTVKTLVETCLPDPDVLRRTKHQHQASTHPRKAKRLGRSAVKRRPHYPDRMVTECGSIQSSAGGLGNTTDGSVRHQRQPTSSSLCLPVSRSGGSGGGCDDHVMDRSLGVCVPTILPSVSSFDKGAVGPSRPDPGRSTLARSQVVSSSVGNASGHTQTAAGTSRPVAAGVSTALQPSQPPSSRVSAIRAALTREGFSEAVASRAAQPQRNSTVAIYESKWRRFVSWCNSRLVDPVAASAAEVADFLLHLSTEQKLQFSTIEGYRMAIASVLRSSCGTEVGRSDTLRALMKSIAQSNVRDQPTVPDWDLLLVLNRLRQAPFEPLRLTSLKLLTWKTLFLVTLASGKRRGEIHALSFERFLHRENWSRVTFSVIPSFIAKTQLLERGAKSLLTFEIRAMASFLGQDFEDDNLLCPVRAIRVYLDRTRSLRKKQQLFFISPHSSFPGDIKPATISAWIRKTIILSYELNKSTASREIRAHSVRAKAVSWAFHHQASLEQVLAAGTWRNASTFTSFYLKEITSTAASGNKLTPFVAAGRVIDLST